MLFNSGDFLIFFPIVVLLYFLIPKKLQKIFLLIASYYFYMCWNAKYAVLIATSTMITFVCAKIISVLQAKKNRLLVLYISIVLNIGILFYFKYLNFALSILSRIFALFSVSLTIPVFDIMLPVGISFYTFQALSYTIDVYLGETEVEKNLLNYALFVSFFPQLVAGPIERSKNLLTQIHEPESFDYERVKSGLLLMVFGYFQKVIIAQRAAAVVDHVYGNFEAYSGVTIAVAFLLFSFQIYCDFGGYSMIAIGSAKVLGFSLMDNFKQPYFADSVKDFWHRWHISLSTWFRDYIYIPLGGSHCSRSRKYCNLLITFLISGLWHGASMHFVVWGGLNGFYQVIEDRFDGLRKKLPLKRTFTFLLVSITWVFFRAESITKALTMIKSMFVTFGFAPLWNGTFLTLGCSLADWKILIAGLLLLLLIDYAHEKKISFRAFLSKRPVVIRFAFYTLVCITFLLQAIATFGQPASSFLYFQF